MRVITADGRSVAVGAGLAAAAAPRSAGDSGSVRLADRPGGMRKSVRYAEVARANPWARAAVDIRASSASRVQLQVHRPKPDDPRPGASERVRAGDPGPGGDLQALLDSPADRLSGRRWRRRILTDLLVHDNALIEAVTSRGRLVELRWQPWIDVKPHVSVDGLTLEAVEVPTERRTGLWLGGRSIATSATRIIDRDDVIHLVPADEVTGEDGPIGTSKIASLKFTHALHDAAMRFAVAYMNNGVFPTGVVELHPQATAAAAQATVELLETLHAGVEQAGKPVAVAGKWQQLMATPEGAKLVELAMWSREEIAAAFRIPLPILGDLSSTNRATSQTAREQFLRDVVGDDVAVLESELQAQLVAPNPAWASAGLWVVGQLGELLRPDMVALSQVIAREVGGPVLVPNEGRRLLGEPPLDDPMADRLILNPGTPNADDDLDDPKDPEEDPADSDDF